MIVKVKTKTKPLVGINGKLCVDMIFTMLLVATVVVGYMGVGRQRVGEQELVRLLGGVVVGLGKEEFVSLLSINEDTAQTGRIVVTSGVVFTIKTSVVDGVLIEVGHCVVLGRTNIAETAVDGPYPDAFRHLFFTLYRVALVGIEVLIAVLIILIDVAVGIHLIIHLSLHTTRHADHQ